MSASNSRKVRLKVRTADAGTEIYVVDGKFALAGKGVSNFEALLDPGVYKVKVRAGFEEKERCVILFGDRDEVVEEFDPLKFLSPIPLVNTAHASAAHISRAAAGAQDVRLDAGQGSWIYVFARECGPAAERGAADAERGNLARGLTLRNLQGELVADISEYAKVEPNDGPSAACCVQVDPGSYRLRVETPSGLSLERSVVASKGWQTQVFLTAGGEVSRETGREADAGRGAAGAACADLAEGAVLLSRSHTFRADDPSLREVELARLGLANRRKVVQAEMRERLSGQFEDPLLGLYGAHLLLLSPEPDVALLKKVVGRLRELLGDHPDVEALALKVEDPRDDYFFNAPPMLRQSWAYVVEATGRRQTLIPPLSLPARIASRLWEGEPWLVWAAPPASEQVQTPSDAIDSDVRDALKKVLKVQLLHMRMAAETSARPPDAADHQPSSIQTGGGNFTQADEPGKGRGTSFRLFDVLWSLFRHVAALMREARKPTAEEQAAAARDVLKSKGARAGVLRRRAGGELDIDEESINKLVSTFGIPRLNLEALLRELGETVDEGTAE